jgi:hypothetical protein
MTPHKLPTTPARRGFFALGLASLFFALAFFPMPLAVLYQLNEECLAASSLGTAHATWTTLHRIPPSPVAHSLDFTVRAAIVGALLAALFLAATAFATLRSRAAALRLHALYVPIQVVLMIALVVAAHRFSTAIEAANLRRAWAVRIESGSAVRNLANVVAALGLLYPLVLALLYWRYPGETHRPTRN